MEGVNRGQKEAVIRGSTIGGTEFSGAYRIIGVHARADMIVDMAVNQPADSKVEQMVN